jgi:hypothetical protein
MGFKKAADGITKSGKTKGTNLGDDGKEIGIEGGKGSKGARTVTSEAMKKVGRNLARAKNQTGGR